MLNRKKRGRMTYIVSILLITITFDTGLFSMNGAPDYISGGLPQRPFLGVKKIGAGRGGSSFLLPIYSTPQCPEKNKEGFSKVSFAGLRVMRKVL